MQVSKTDFSLPSKGGKRQLSLLFLDVRDWMEKAELRGLCFRRFKENILITREDEEYIPREGDLLKIGDCLIRVTEAGKKCFSECAREQAGMECKLRDLCFFAEYVEKAEIQEGMEVCLEP